MIEPTVGRIVWYWPALSGGLNRPDLIENYMATVQPQAAIVAFVYPGGEAINITRFSRDSVAIPELGVPLVQENADGVIKRPTHGGWCEWMPYQKGQAAKTEAAEKEVEASRQDGIALSGGDANVDPVV